MTLALATSSAPPQNLDAERSLLGGILLDNEALLDVSSILAPTHFYREAHRKIFEAMSAISARNEPIDRVTLKAELISHGLLDAVGGDDAIDLLDKLVPSASNLGYYAQIVRDAALWRGIQEAGVSIARAGKEAQGDPAEALDAAEARFSALRISTTKSEPEQVKALLTPTFKTIQKLFERQEDVTGIPTGIAGLDRLTTGWQPGDLIILAARPSIGKTAYMLNCATTAGLRHERDKKRVTVAIFSLEMPKEQLVMRMLAAEGRVGLQRIRSGKLIESDWPRLASAAGNLAKASIEIDDTRNLSVMELRAKARRIARRAPADAPLGLVCVDYLQLMHGREGADTREQQVSEMGRGLKMLAGELAVPVLALSQLSRAMEKRGEGAKPRLSDLRESGALEQDADTVIFVHRASLGDDHGELIIGKQRNGPVETVEVDFQREWGLFMDKSTAGPRGPNPPPFNEPEAA